MTREEMIALGLDPDKEVINMGGESSPLTSPDMIIPYHPDYAPSEPSIPMRRGNHQETITPEPIVREPLPMDDDLPDLTPSVPKKSVESLEDRQANALAALDVLREQDATAEPREISDQLTKKESPRDVLSEYMDMLKSLRGEESEALKKGKEDLESARKRDVIASTLANIAGAWAGAHGSKMTGKDMYGGQIGQAAKEDYAELLRQFKDRKSDLSSELGDLGRIQSIRKGESDFRLLEGSRDPESEMSRLYRDMFRERFKDTPISDDVSAAEVQDLLKMKANSGELTEKDQQYFALMREQIRQKELDREARVVNQEDLALNRAFRRKEADELPSKQQEQLTNNLKTIDALKRLEDNVLVEDFAGPIAQRLHKARRFVGIDNAQASAMQAQAVDIAAQYIKNISGVAVSEPEFQRLSQALPNLLDKPETVGAVIKDIKRRLQRENEIMLDVFSRTKDIKPFMDIHQSSRDTSKYLSDPRVKKFMEKNNIDNPDEAINILKKHGVLK